MPAKRTELFWMFLFESKLHKSMRWMPIETNAINIMDVFNVFRNIQTNKQIWIAKSVSKPMWDFVIILHSNCIQMPFFHFTLFTSALLMMTDCDIFKRVISDHAYDFFKVSRLYFTHLDKQECDHACDFFKIYRLYFSHFDRREEKIIEPFWSARFFAKIKLKYF